MRFANPEMLWLLLILPLLMIGLALRAAWRKQLVASVGDPTQLRRLTAAASPVRRGIKNTFWIIALALMIVAMARPQAGERTTLASARGIDIVVALDFSKSMLARDAYPSRLERAKAELSRLLDALGGDRVGLVAFAGETLSYPLTTDYAAAKLFWRDMTPADMPVGGTAIGKAIVAATRLLTAVRGKSSERSQVILLLTDGEDHESDPARAAEAAAKLGIRIFAVGIGSPSGEPVPDVTQEGSLAGYMKNNEGAPITSKLDSTSLRRIAEVTHGTYIEMSSQEFGVEPILAELATFKKTEIQERLVKHYDEAYPWVVAPAALLIGVEMILPTRRRRARKNRHE